MSRTWRAEPGSSLTKLLKTSDKDHQTGDGADPASTVAALGSSVASAFPTAD